MDSAGVIAACIQAASRDMGLPVPSREEASHIIGLGLRQALETLFPDLPEDKHQPLADHYRRHFLGQDAEIPLFEGARELIVDLRDRAICWRWPPARPGGGWTGPSSIPA
jgi:phosphoglycolate phosphatase